MAPQGRIIESSSWRHHREHRVGGSGQPALLGPDQLFEEKRVAGRALDDAGYVGIRDLAQALPYQELARAVLARYAVGAVELVPV